MTTAHGNTFIVEIEGIANSTGQARYYTRDVSYSTAAYNGGLAEPPRGSGSGWDPIESKSSSGRFTLSFRPDVGPVNWMMANPPAATFTAENTTAGAGDTDISVVHDTGNLDLDVIYTDRETWQQTSEPSASVIRVTRAYGGSALAAHSWGSALYESPPALVGRKATVYRVAHDGAGTGDETVVAQGYISAEPVDRIAKIEINCQEWWPGWEVNHNPDHNVVQWRGGRVLFDVREAPKYHASGTLFYIPDLEAVISAGWNGSTWNSNGSLIWAKDEVTPDESAKYNAYEVAYSDVLAPYPVFGYKPHLGSWTYSANPIDILLNILVSDDGANLTSGDTSWDASTLLYPHAGFGIPIADIDIESFRQAREELSSVRARRFWLGGNKTEKITDLARRLVGIWGYCLALKRTGDWTLLKLRDVYPGDDLNALTKANVGGDLTQTILARPTDTIQVYLTNGPAKNKRDVITVEEVSRREFYPSWQSESAELEFADVPYAVFDFDDVTTMYTFLANHLSRISGRLAEVRGLHIGESMFDSIEVGSRITVHDLALRNPVTGSRLVAADDALKGLVAQVSNIDHYRMTADLRVYLTGNNRVARIAPSAVVVSWNDFPNYTATVTEHAYSLDTNTLGDAEYFSAGDYCLLLDSHGAPRSNDGAANKWEVSSVTATTIDFVGPPKSGAIGFQPNAGDIIVFTKYDNVQASQIGTYAFGADDAPPDDSFLGTGDDAPYVYGD